MPTPIHVALAAYGLSGRVFHAPFLAEHPGFVLSSILERSKNESALRYPEARIVRRFEDIIQDPAIELVVINTPNTLHYSMAKAALEAGKHVVLEKPFTNTRAEGQTLIELAQAQNLMLSVYHNRRLQSGFKTVQQLLAHNALGRLNTFEVSIDRYRPAPGPKKWKESPHPGAGLLYDLGSHLLDEAMMLFGLPLAVTADIRAERNGSEVCDYFHIRLDYPHHKCLLRASMLALAPAPAYVLHGETGSFIKQTPDVQEMRLAEGIRPRGSDWARETPAQWGTLTTSNGPQAYPTVDGDYSAYYDNIYRHLRHNEPLLVLPEQALVSIGMIEVAERSAQERCTIELV